MRQIIWEYLLQKKIVEIKKKLNDAPFLLLIRQQKDFMFITAQVRKLDYYAHVMMKLKKEYRLKCCF